MVILAVTSFIAWTAAAVGLGFRVGSDRVPEAVQPAGDIDVLIEGVDIPDAPVDEDIDVTVPRMINVLGLTPVEAQSALSDVGIVTDVVITPTGNAGEPGFIIDQSPGAGSPVDGPVELAESIPVDVPDLVGAVRDDAVRQLEALGSQVSFEQVYRRDVPVGQVLALAPATGSLPREIALTVSSPPAEVDLVNVPSLRNACGSPAPANLNGRAAPLTIPCRLTRDELSVEWNLGRSVDQVVFEAGVTDTSDTRAAAAVAVVADGQVIATETVSFGMPAAFNVSVAGVLRLEIRVTPPGAALRTDWTPSTVAIADLIVTGSPEAIDELAGLNT